MISRLKPKQENTSEKLTHIQQLPKRQAIPERKKIKRLLRVMLSMEEEQRQLKEEQNLFR